MQQQQPPQPIRHARRASRNRHQPAAHKVAPVRIDNHASSVAALAALQPDNEKERPASPSYSPTVDADLGFVATNLVLAQDAHARAITAAQDRLEVVRAATRALLGALALEKVPFVDGIVKFCRALALNVPHLHVGAAFVRLGASPDYPSAYRCIEFKVDGRLWRKVPTEAHEESAAATTPGSIYAWGDMSCDWVTHLDGSICAHKPSEDATVYTVGKPQSLAEEMLAVQELYKFLQARVPEYMDKMGVIGMPLSDTHVRDLFR
jgi:hypothetical protein